MKKTLFHQVRAKAREYEFSRLMKMKPNHESRMGLLNSSKLCMQDYLKLENFDKQTAQTVFRYRIRMTKYGKLEKTNGLITLIRPNHFGQC